MEWSPGAVAVKYCDIHNAIIFHCYSLYFDTHLAGYTEVKNQIKQSFLHDF